MVRTREARFQTYDSRWGQGRVHRYLYSTENRLWYIACRSPGSYVHGRRTNDDAEVTCLRCDPGTRVQGEGKTGLKTALSA